MKPEPNVTGIPYNFDLLPIWIYPDLWDETKRVRLRGLWFVLLYMLSVWIFFAIVGIVLGLIFSTRTIVVMLYFSLIISPPFGGIVGLACWWDFTRRRRKLLEIKNTEVKS